MMEQLCAEHETVDTMLEELLRQMSGPLLVPTRGRPPLAEITFHCLDCLDLHYSKPARRTRVVTRQGDYTVKQGTRFEPTCRRGLGPSFSRKSRLRLAVFSVCLSEPGPKRARTYSCTSIHAGKSTFSALVREVHWSLKKRFHPAP
eukprot:scaffold96000_cov68-Phaeocystis_antarctica.AAC.1